MKVPETVVGLAGLALRPETDDEEEEGVIIAGGRSWRAGAFAGRMSDMEAEEKREWW